MGFAFLLDLWGAFFTGFIALRACNAHRLLASRVAHSSIPVLLLTSRTAFFRSPHGAMSL
jgi:hypothetical protein